MFDNYMVVDLSAEERILLIEETSPVGQNYVRIYPQLVEVIPSFITLVRLGVLYKLYAAGDYYMTIKSKDHFYSGDKVIIRIEDDDELPF